MRDMAGKIAELKFEAPLARFEEEDTASLKNMNLLTGGLDCFNTGRTMKNSRVDYVNINEPCDISLTVYVETFQRVTEIDTDDDGFSWNRDLALIFPFSCDDFLSPTLPNKRTAIDQSRCHTIQALLGEIEVHNQFNKKFF